MLRPAASADGMPFWLREFDETERRVVEGLLPLWEASTDAHCVVDDVGRIVWSNPTMLELFASAGPVSVDWVLRGISPADRNTLRELIHAPGPKASAVFELIGVGPEPLPVCCHVARLGDSHALLAVQPHNATGHDAIDERVRELEDALADIGAKLVELGVGNSAVVNDGRKVLPVTLSGRQREVCALLLAGLGEHEIAEALYISVHTVRNHKKAAFRVLDLHSTRQLLHVYRPDAVAQPRSA